MSSYNRDCPKCGVSHPAGAVRRGNGHDLPKMSEKPFKPRSEALVGPETVFSGIFKMRIGADGANHRQAAQAQRPDKWHTRLNGQLPMQLAQGGTRVKKIVAIGIAAAIVALGAVSTVSADTPDCITAGLNDDTCVWKPELTSVEVKVEYEYPYCEIKLEVEDNLDELPEGVTIGGFDDAGQIKRISRGNHVNPGSQARIVVTNPEGNESALSPLSHLHKHPPTTEWGPAIHIPGYRGRIAKWSWSAKFQSDYGGIQSTAARYLGWQGHTLDTLTLVIPSVSYGDEYDEYRQKVRVGNKFIDHVDRLQRSFVSEPIPISHTFSGLSEAIFACGETARREEARIEERKALETERAGLRAALTLLEGELERAQLHETQAANLLKEVIAIGERVGELHRTIHRIRVEGLAERRKMVERYYTEESTKYSLFLRSLETQEAILTAADIAIAAQKAELDASRARLEKMVADAQAAEDALITEIEKTREALGEGEEPN